ncbi:MAG: hypothetical protein JEZ14_22995 [Marinilabiliaceae bacterium]|nr:hypothetical protein [Marinilabiliaceae bacterium]
MFQRIFLLFCFYSFFSFSHAQDSRNDAVFIHVIDSLIAKGQYATAFEKLDKQDPVNKNNGLVIKKCELAMNYYLSSMKYHAFSFVNLRADETIEELRSYSHTNVQKMIPFTIDSVLLSAIEQEPENYCLHKTLGDFYYKVFLDFGDRWYLPSEELLEKSKQYFLMAYKHRVYDYYSLYALGYYHTLFENYHEAQQWFLLSIKENPNEPLTAYNLAVSYLFDGLFKEGIQYAQQAYVQYNDSLKKGDAARITGILLFNNQEFDEALKYFTEANALSPDYRPNQLYLLRSLLNRNMDGQAYKLALEVLLPSLHDPDIPDEYVELFQQQQKQELLTTIFKDVLKKYPKDYEAKGNIRFHYGKLLYKEGHSGKAFRMFKKSRKDFEMVFPADHPVFQSLDQMIQQLSDHK